MKSLYEGPVASHSTSLSSLSTNPSASIDLPSTTSTSSAGLPFNVSAGMGPWFTMYDPTNNLVYVGSDTSSAVTVISPVTGLTVATIGTGLEPSGLAYDPIHNQIFAANNGGDNVSVIDPVTNKVVASIGLGATAPAWALYDPANQLVYITNQVTDNLTVINTTTDRTVKSIGVGTNPVGLIYDSWNNDIYVPSAGGNITVVSGTYNTQKANLTIGGLLEGGTFDPQNGVVYVDSVTGGALEAVSGWPPVVSGSVVVGGFPRGAVYDPADGDIYVGNSGENYISIVDPLTMVTPAQATGAFDTWEPTYDSQNGMVFFPQFGISTVGGLNDAQYGVTALEPLPSASGATGFIASPAIDTSTNVLWVPEHSTDSVGEFDAATGHFIATVGAGTGPVSALFDPLNDEVYVSNLGGSNLTVYPVGGGVSTTSITVGTEPWGLTMDPVTGTIYVADLGSSSLSAVAPGNPAVVTNIPITKCASPIDPVFDPSNGLVYVSCDGDAYVQIVSTSNNTADGLIYLSSSMGTNYVALVLDSVTDELVVANRGEAGATNAYAEVFSTTDNASLAVLTDIDSRQFFGGGVDPISGDIVLFGQDGAYPIDPFNFETSWNASIDFSETAQPDVLTGAVWDSSLEEWAALNTGSTATGLQFIDTGPYPYSLYTSSYQLGADVGQYVELYAYVDYSGTLASGAFLGVPGCEAVGLDYPYEDCYPSTVGSFPLTVVATDMYGMSSNFEDTFVVQADPVVTVVAVSPSTTFDVGQTVMFHATVSGGWSGGAYYWSPNSADLSCPAGNSAWLNCTAAAPGTGVNVSVVWVDGAHADSASVASPNISIGLAPFDVSAPTASSPNPEGSDLGQTVTFTATVMGGSSPLTYAWVGLPTGCSTADSLSVICTPSAAGTYWVSLNVTDAAQVTVPGPSLAYVVSAAADVTVSVTPAGGTGEVGSELTLSASVLGGSGAGWFAWTTPASLGCVTTQGPLATCWPTATATAVTASATITDTNGATSTGTSAPINVAAALSLGAVTAKTHTLDVGQSVVLGVAESGGVAPYTYTWTGLPNCPSSTTDNDTCTADAVGAYAVTVWVTDALGVKAESAAPAALIVSAALSAPTVTASSTSVTVNNAVSFTAVASGGAAPYTYAWTGLPSGCTATGAVAVCTPGSSGTLTVSVVVTDANGATSTASTSTTVSVGAAPSTTSALDLGSLGLAVVALVIALLAFLFAMRKGKGGSGSTPMSTTTTSTPAPMPASPPPPAPSPPPPPR